MRKEASSRDAEAIPVLQINISHQKLAAKAKGKRLGRPKGALGKSKLDGKEQDIELLLRKPVSNASMARIVEISPTTLHHVIHTRQLQPTKRERV